MENIVNFKGKEIKWDYKICPCLECPIYPLRKEWEDEPDIRKDKCYTSRCTYSRLKGKEVAEYVSFILSNKKCDGCEGWLDKNEIQCYHCGADLF